MKTVPANLQTDFEAHNVAPATLWKITRRDGQVFTFTDHVADIDYDDGGGTLTYKSATGYTRSAVASTATMSVDNLDIQAAYDSDVAKADLQAGKWDFAEVLIFVVNYRDISHGAAKPRRGWLGEVSLSDTFTVELNGMLQILAHEIVELTDAKCRANFGDSRCKIDVTGSEWAATTAYTARSDFSANNEQAVYPTTPNYRFYITKDGGTSGGSEPSWPTTLGATVDDNGITWEAVQARWVDAVIRIWMSAFGG